MTDALKDFYEAVSIIDLIYLVLTTLSLIKCYRKGFILSVLAASKWLLAYIVTLILFPKIKPYFKDLIDSEYVLDITLGLSIFIVVVFLMLLVNKGINKAIKYTGLGRIDSIFGLFFGFVRSFYICVAIFSAINIVYNYDRWSIDTNKSYIFPYLEKGSNYLIKEFPNEETYKNSKEKIEDI
jgi:membrane protein required for colicin V production